MFFGLCIVLYVVMGYFVDGFDWFFVGVGDVIGEVGVIFVDYCLDDLVYCWIYWMGDIEGICEMGGVDIIGMYVDFVQCVVEVWYYIEDVD